MQLLHELSRLSMKFDEPNLVACAGLAPVMALADSCGLAELVKTTVTVPGSAGANAYLKVSALVAGMAAGADCIDDMDLLRHGGMDRLFGGIRAPSTLGTFLRAFTFGHVRQLDAVAATVLAGLAERSPLLGSAAAVAFVRRRRNRCAPLHTEGATCSADGSCGCGPNAGRLSGAAER